MYSDEKGRARLKAMYDLEVRELLKPVKPKRKDYYASRTLNLKARGLIM